MGHYDSCYEREEQEAEKKANPDYRASQVFAEQAKEIKRKMDNLLSKYQKDKELLQADLDRAEWAQQQICPHLHCGSGGFCPDCGGRKIR